MKNNCFRVTILALFLSISSACYAQDKREFVITEGDTSYTMKQYYFCMLKKGPNRSQDSATAAKIQAGHMEHLDKLAKLGKLLVAGPFGDESDWRGILIFDVESKEEVMRLEGDDPAVKSGRLVMEIHPWWTMKGKLED
jgi:uncharacterized protein YciI